MQLLAAKFADGKYHKEDVSLEESKSWCIWLTRTYDENKERDKDGVRKTTQN